MNTKHIKRVGVGLLGIAAVMGGTSVMASDAGEVIHACVANKGGAVRIANVCKSTETPIEWNKQGEPGAPATILPVIGTSESTVGEPNAVAVALRSTCPGGKYPIGRMLHGVPEGETVLTDTGGATTPGGTWTVVISKDVGGTLASPVNMGAICI